MHTLNQLLLRLADAGVDFVVIGGYAGVLHGSSLVTRNLEICAVLTEANVAQLRRVLAELHPKHRLTPQALSFLDTPPPGTPLDNLYLRTDWGTVDILSRVLGVGDFERLKRQAESFVLESKRIRLIALDDLIRAKEALGREKDLLAAKELRAIAALRAKDDS